MKYLSNSDIETIEKGKELGTFLSGGDIVALTGPLGSGKTWFSKGIGLGLGVDPDEVIVSPSFSLVNEYRGRHTLYHMDLYRLDTINEIIAIGIDEYVNEENVVVIEWAERCREILPGGYVEVNIRILGENEREIEILSEKYREI